MTFSVVIATHNRARLLEKTLDALRLQTWPAHDVEIIVADNGSTDRTREVVRSAMHAGGPHVRYLYVARQGKSFAVNAALAEADGTFLAFTDDDVQPDRRWLEQLAATFEETGADFIAGRVLPIWEAPRPAWLSPAIYGVIAVPDSGNVAVDITPGGDQSIMTIGANMAVSRRVIDRVGGLRGELGKLEGTLRTAEDHEYFLRMLRAGFRGRYEPRAQVHHWVPATRLSRRYFRRWMFQNGRDVGYLEPLFPSTTARLLGTPRYLWRQAAENALALAVASLSFKSAERFRASLRLLWFGGYLLETWLPPRRPRSTLPSTSHAG